MVDKLGFLLEHGVGDRRHTGGGLCAHLIGTRELLSRWQMPETVCDAGLYHSIYGTDNYPETSIPIERRQVVRNVIGEEAELLCFLFCIIERLSLYSSLSSDDPPSCVRSRYGGAALKLDEQTYSALCHIALANWLEQRGRAPQELRHQRDKIFRAMLPFLVPAARAAARDISEPNA